jgi:hypothetical protein
MSSQREQKSAFGGGRERAVVDGRAVPRRDVLRAAAAGVAGIVAGGLARPTATLGAVGGGHHGNLGAITKQLWGTGLFIGNEFEEWSNSTRRSVFSRIRGWKFDFVCPKVGGYGTTWYSSDSELRDWRNWAHDVGLGFVPFIYSVPGSSTRDAEICSELGNDCGIVVVDMEVEYRGANSAMANFGNVFRKHNPRTPIIVTGLGDPVYAYGAGGWPFKEMAYWADGYGPQWYYGEWLVYHESGVKAAINWGDSSCAQAFGDNFPLIPALSIYTVYTNSGILPLRDITTGENYAKNWKAPIFWWEYGGMNASIAAACRA